MSILFGISVYLTLWWTILFVILPLGSRSYAEMNLPVPGGGDPSAPVEPRLKRKFITTTWVSAVIFAIFWVVVHFHLLSLPAWALLG